MATYLTTTSELTAIADAIRAKSGITGTLNYPDGFVNTISAIPTSGLSVNPGIVPADFTLLENHIYYPTTAIVKLATGDDNKYLGHTFSGAHRSTSSVVGSGLCGYWTYLQNVRIDVNDNTNITVIPEYMFYNLPYLQTLPIDMSHITTIEPYAFGFDIVTMTSQPAAQNGTIDINLPVVSTIGVEAFRYNRKIKTLTIGTYGEHTLNTISARAFGYTYYLTSINILEMPSGEIGSNCFTMAGSGNCEFNVVWGEGDVPGAPWGFNGTINYNYRPPQE